MSKPVSVTASVHGRDHMVTYDQYGTPNSNNAPPIQSGRYFKGGPGTGKINDRGSPVRLTLQWYFYDMVKSALQKAIRRGRWFEACLWAKKMYDMGGPFQSNLLNRLRVIVSEDINIACPRMVIEFVKRMNVVDRLKGSVRLADHRRREMLMYEIVKALSLCYKSRLTDNLIHATMEPDLKTWPMGFQKLVFAKGPTNLYMGKKGDSKKYIEYMNYLVKALNDWNEQAACFWAQMIFDIDPDERKCCRRKTSKGSSNDPMYGIWELLLKKAAFDAVEKKRIECLLKLYDEKKNGRTERLFLVDAIIYHCRKTNLQRLMTIDGNIFQIDEETWRRIQENPVIQMRDEYCDKHTEFGKLKNRGSQHFWDVGALLVNVPSDIVDRYFERAKALNVARDNVKMRPPRRKVKKAPKGKRGKKRKRVGEGPDDPKTKKQKTSNTPVVTEVNIDGLGSLIKMLDAPSDSDD